MKEKYLQLLKWHSAVREGWLILHSLSLFVCLFVCLSVSQCVQRADGSGGQKLFLSLLLLVLCALEHLPEGSR